MWKSVFVRIHFSTFLSRFPVESLWIAGIVFLSLPEVWNTFFLSTYLSAGLSPAGEEMNRPVRELSHRIHTPYYDYYG